MTPRPHPALLLLVLLLVLAPAAHAQSGTGRVHMTREALQQMASEHEAAAAAPAYSAAFRDQARRQAESIRVRLRDGDFRVGDRVAVQVEGMPALTDTLTVAPGPSLTIPTLGALPVQGLLRSELEARIRAFVAQYVRSPVVQVQPMLRVAVEGAVGRPGFYEIPAEALVSDLLMLAGGPAADANLRQVQVHRLGAQVWDGAYMERALAAGWTLDQLGVHPGDRVAVVAKRKGSPASALLRAAGGVAAAIGVISRL